MRLAGKRALVTGGSRGIGRAIAERLAADGAHVIVHYGQNAAAAQETVAQIEAAGGQAVALQCELRDVGAIRKMFADFEGGLDVLVNCAGVFDFAPIADVTEEAFDRQFDINVKALLFVTQQALPRLADGGRIINISSASASKARPYVIAYGASKGAVESFTLSLAQELGPRRITVNAVSPGMTATPEIVAMLAGDASRERAAVSAIALGRVGMPDDIAEVVAFLASDEGRWITGQVIAADGGTDL